MICVLRGAKTWESNDILHVSIKVLVPSNRDILWLIEAEEEHIQDYRVAYEISQKVGGSDMGKRRIQEDHVGIRMAEIPGTKGQAETPSPTTEYLAATTSLVGCAPE